MPYPQQAQRARFGIKLAREAARFFPLGNVGLDLLLDEATRGGSGHLVCLVEVGGVDGVGHGGLRWLPHGNEGIREGQRSEASAA